MAAAPPVDDLLAHLHWFVGHAPFGRGGHGDGELWISSLDLATGRQPAGGRPPGVDKRCYRSIEAPGGSNLYWDLPLVAACGALARRHGSAELDEAARSYLRDFLGRCVADNGLFWWGNHYYVDAASSRVLWFYGDDTVPTPVGPEHADAWLHELRPLRVPWDLLAEVDAAAVRRCIVRMAERHVYDRDSGGFNRHADGQRGFAFLEAGAILVESFCWAAAHFDEPALLETARRVAGYSFAHRDENTGLLSNSPGVERWDRHVCSNEVGHWARCLLRAEELSGERSFGDMACAALGAWLERAWDPQREAFHGMIALRDGTPVRSDPGYAYQPGDHCDPWQPLFPVHDYPMPCAEACLDAWVRNGETRFRDGAQRWLRQLTASLPARGGRGGYAEHYGRAIRFARRAARELDDAGAAGLAERLQTEAVGALRAAPGRLRSHPGEDRCDAVDGMGFLALALAGLEAADPVLDALW